MSILNSKLESMQTASVRSALIVAARSISTSYRDVMTPELLSTILRSGEAPTQYQPHLMMLLDETPLPIVAQAISEAATPEVTPQCILKNLSRWAEQWKSHRTVW